MAIVYKNPSASTELYQLLCEKAKPANGKNDVVAMHKKVILAAYQAAAILVRALHKDRALFELLASQVPQTLANFFLSHVDPDPELYKQLSSIKQRHEYPFGSDGQNAYFHFINQFWQQNIGDEIITPEDFEVICQAFPECADPIRFYHRPITLITKKAMNITGMKIGQLYNATRIHSDNDAFFANPFTNVQYLSDDAKNTFLLRSQPVLQDKQLISNERAMAWLLSASRRKGFEHLSAQQHPFTKSSTALFLHVGLSNNCDYHKYSWQKAYDPFSEHCLTTTKNKEFIGSLMLLGHMFPSSYADNDAWFPKTATAPAHWTDLIQVAIDYPSLEQLPIPDLEHHYKAIAKAQSFKELLALSVRYEAGLPLFDAKTGEQTTTLHPCDSAEEKLRHYLSDVLITRALMSRLDELCQHADANFQKWASTSICNNIAGVISTMSRRGHVRGITDAAEEINLNGDHRRFIKHWCYNLDLPHVASLLGNIFAYKSKNLDHAQYSEAGLQTILYNACYHLPTPCGFRFFASEALSQKDKEYVFSMTPVFPVESIMTPFQTQYAARAASLFTDKIGRDWHAMKVYSAFDEAASEKKSGELFMDNVDTFNEWFSQEINVIHNEHLGSVYSGIITERLDSAPTSEAMPRL